MSVATKSSFKKYLYVFSGQLFSLFGSMTIHFALIWWLTIETEDATLLSIASVISFVPFVIAIPIAGVLCDRWNRKKTIILADLGQAIITFAIILAFIQGNPNIWFVIAMNGVRGIFQAFHSPAINAIIPIMVPKENLSRLNGLRFATSGLVSVLSPIIGASLMAFMSITQILWIDIITFIIAMIPLVLVQIPSIKQPEQKKEKLSFFKELNEGFLTVKKTKGMIHLMVWSLLINFVLRPFHVLLPYYIRVNHGGNETNFALVMIFAQIGWVLGSLISMLKKNWKNLSKIVLNTGIVACIGNVIVAFAPNQVFWLVGLGRLICTMMISWGISAYYTILQTAVSADKQGRIYSFDLFISNLIAPIAMGFSGPLANIFGIVGFLALCGFIGILINFVMYFAGMGKLPYGSDYKDANSLITYNETTASEGETNADNAIQAS